MKHVNDAPRPPSATAPGIPADLDRVVLRCLAKNPADRYQMAEELDSDLARVEAGLPVSRETAQAATVVLAGASTAADPGARDASPDSGDRPAAAGERPAAAALRPLRSSAQAPVDRALDRRRPPARRVRRRRLVRLPADRRATAGGGAGRGPERRGAGRGSSRRATRGRRASASRPRDRQASRSTGGR